MENILFAAILEKIDIGNIIREFKQEYDTDLKIEKKKEVCLFIIEDVYSEALLQDMSYFIRDLFVEMEIVQRKKNQLH
jgi:hypothetical protein